MIENSRQKDINHMEVWSPKEIIESGIPRTLAYALVHREGFPSIRIGGRWFVRRESFIAWLKSQERV